MPSFDIVIEVDLQEVDNAVNQAKKELLSRYDFKNSKSSIDWDKKEQITLLADDDYKLNAVTEILKSKFAKRGLSVKNLEFGKPEPSFEGTLRQQIKVQQGIPEDKAKSLVKMIKASPLKVQPSIQDEQVRVTGKKRDDLQQIMALVRGSDLGLDFKFNNLRD